MNLKYLLETPGNLLEFCFHGLLDTLMQLRYLSSDETYSSVTHDRPCLRRGVLEETAECWSSALTVRLCCVHSASSSMARLTYSQHTTILYTTVFTRTKRYCCFHTVRTKPLPGKHNKLEALWSSSFYVYVINVWYCVFFLSFTLHLLLCCTVLGLYFWF